MRIINPKTNELVALPLELPLTVKIDSRDGKIVETGVYQHKVNWIDSGLSLIEYCNSCGSGLFYVGFFMCEDNIKRRAKVCVCGEFLGFSN